MNNNQYHCHDYFRLWYWMFWQTVNFDRSDLARDFYKKMKIYIEDGGKFAFDIPYQIGLIKNRLGVNLVGIFLQQHASNDCSVETQNTLKKWFIDSGILANHPYPNNLESDGLEVVGDSMQDTIKALYYDQIILEYFGTIPIGEMTTLNLYKG